MSWRALSQTFASPFRMAVGAAGDVFVCADECVWKVTPNGKASVFVARGKIEEASDLAFDHEQNLLVVDALSKSLKKVDAKGKITTFAKGFDVPSGIAVNALGEVFVSEMYQNCIRKIDRVGNVTTFASKLKRPCSLAFGPHGALFVGEEKSVRRVDTSGKVSALYEKKFDVGSIAVDADGNVFASSHRVVRMIDTAGKIMDMSGPNSRKADYVALALDGRGTLYVSDYANDLVYAVTL